MQTEKSSELWGIPMFKEEEPVKDTKKMKKTTWGRRRREENDQPCQMLLRCQEENEDQEMPTKSGNMDANTDVEMNSFGGDIEMKIWVAWTQKS